MLILRAAELGMCFGVRDALDVIEAVPNPTDVTIHGELVHNQEVLRDLDRRGFAHSNEDARPVPSTPVVLVTAHGISDRERDRLRQAGKQLIDTTCPLVQKAHAAAQQLQREGYRVIVFGKRDHVEVRGIIEDLERPIVVGSPADVASWPDSKLGVVCQTTTQSEVAASLLALVRAQNPHASVRFADTICSPTKARIEALTDLLPRIDALVVIGGHNSNNTKQLVRTAEAHGVPTLHVENAAELNAEWFAGHSVVGLTAGTSTLRQTIDEVHAALVRLDGAVRASPPQVRQRLQGRAPSE
ncbi:MAG: 4-hydroxy-3-methylbut-2-enyl diphosphate reductase [Planctomycetota bacterium]